MTTSPNPTIGRLVLLALGAALIALAVVPWLIVGDLPDPLATRWGTGGEPTSSSSVAVLKAVSSVLGVGAAVGLAVLAFVRRPMAPGKRPVVAGIVALLGAFIVLPVMQILMANDGHEQWRDASGPAVWQVVAIVAVAFAAGALASWAASSLPARDVGHVPATPLDVADTAQVSWSRSLTTRRLLAVGLVLEVAGLAFVAFGRFEVGVVLVLVGLPGIVLSRIAVFADHRGLTVTYGWWSWPRTRVPIDRIASATAIDMVPSEWGGWGYRGSLKVFRHAAVVLRAGPGLQLDLVDGRRFAVTVDDPGTAAAVLTRETARLSG